MGELYDILKASSLRGGAGGGGTPGDLASKDITAMTGYTKAVTGSAISTTDTLNQAIGKVEKRAEVNENNILSGNIATNNAYTLISEYTQGVVILKGYNINTDGGFIQSSTNTRATHYSLIKYASGVTINNSDYECAVFCYSATGAYLGRINTDGIISKTGTIRYANSFDLSAFEYSYRLQIKRKNDAEINLNDVQNSVIFTVASYNAPDRQYHMVGSPSIYAPTATTGENIDSLVCADIYAIYDSLAMANPDLISRDIDIGVDSDNNAIRAYTIRYSNPIVSKNETDYSIAYSVFETSSDLQHILICAGVHGDEKTSVFGVAKLVEELLTSTENWATYIKSNFVLHILPIANPWGFDNNSRVNKDGVNINRDFSAFATTEAQAIRDYISRIGSNLKVVIDSHNTILKAPYLLTKKDFKYYNLYVRSAIQLASVLNPYLSSVCDTNLRPYIRAAISPNSDTLNGYANSINDIKSVTVETPATYDSGYSNNSTVVPLVKAIIANLMQIYGQA